MPIPDRQFTAAEVSRVAAKETLFGGKMPPVAAIDRLAVALFECEINWTAHMPNEKQEFDKLDEAGRERLLREACWLLGRLAIVGYRVIYQRP